MIPLPTRAILLAALMWFAGATARGQGSAFVNFETAPTHPIALSPDGQKLAVCNLPDGGVEIFDVTGTRPKRLGAIFTGLDPVTVRFNGNSELWVINHIADSISVIDPARLTIIAMLDCFDAPADVVFTTNPPRAYVSHSGANLVEVWDLQTRSSIDVIEIDGDRPKAMALSSDQSEIYIAIQESGNSSTIIAPHFTGLDHTPTAGANDLPDSPHSGLNPFPNANDIFDPPINPAIPSTNPPPRVSLIVRKQNGRWLDDTKADWTEYISGTNAFLTGRVPGWDVADHDVAIVSTKSNTVRYVRGLMNFCFDLSVNPVSGKVAVVGTDSINEVRFEPNLKAIFTRMKFASVDPRDSTSTVRDLNPHLDYIKRSLPLAERKQTVGDPRAIAWNSRGTRAYVTGMGSNNILMLDADGNRVRSAVDLPDGPTGIAVDDVRGRVYVFCRFDSKLIALDAESLAVLNETPMHDSTPAAIRVGRKHFYNTIDNSGLGQVSCASCHIDGRLDRLAWDLGDQTGDMLVVTNRNFNTAGVTTNRFHPMKGPMVTQTLQDIVGHEPFHWRGDRDSLAQFSPTFVALQGREEEPTPDEMQEFEDFLATLTFQPNPFRNLDNSLSSALDMTNEKAFGKGTVPAGQPLPPGSAIRGLALFRSPINEGCASCHTLPSGVGADARFLVGRWQPIPATSTLEHHVTMIAGRRTLGLPFKVQQLRNLFEKNGFSLRGPVSRAGFGFFHDGRVDSLTRFIQDGFALDDQQTADVIAFLLSFTGSDLPNGVATDIFRPPGLPSRDVPAGVGLQTIIASGVANQRSLFMAAHARSSTSRVDLVVHGFKDGVPRSWLMRGLVFASDRRGETNTSNELLAFAKPNQPLLFTLVPLGSGVRLALDRDGDTFFNQNEIEAASDPDDPNVTPETTTPRLSSFGVVTDFARLEWFGRVGSSYRVQSRPAFADNTPWTDHSELIVISANPVVWSEPINVAAEARFYRIVHVP